MWQQRYNKDLCQQIVEQGKKIEPQDAIIGFSGSNIDTRVRRSKVRWITVFVVLEYSPIFGYKFHHKPYVVGHRYKETVAGR